MNLQTINNPLASLIFKICSENDIYWDGSLWRSATDHQEGSYYHIEKEGAAFYGDPHKYKCPIRDNPLLLNFFTWNGTDIIAKYSGKTRQELVQKGEIFELVDKLLPAFKNDGFDCVIIFGESGRDVTGFPIEVVLL